MILDYIGGDYAEKNIKLLAEDGRMVIIGFLKGPRVGAIIMCDAGEHLAEPDSAASSDDHGLDAAFAPEHVQA